MSAPSNLRLARFIRQEIDAILVEWNDFAATCLPAAATMSPVALTDHAEGILRAIATDMDSPQTETERDSKSRGHVKPLEARETAATVHGALRHLDGYNLVQVVAEYRALRATVLRLWKTQRPPEFEDTEDITRFNEGMDQALAESIAAYSLKIDESRDTFLAVLGHDLRGPLATLSNCIHLLQRPGKGPAGGERMFHIATRSIASMNGLITDLLEYTRTRLGKGIAVVGKPGDFGAFCLEVVEEARAGHPTRHFDYTASGTSTLVFDESRMRQALGNLLNNAVQHGDANSPVAVTVAGEDDEIRLTVVNRGEPIPPEALQVIFNPLVQVAEARTEPHERPSTSMGLGLFIAHEIVEAHGGTIGVTSSAEAGTTFTVHLPKDRGAVHGRSRTASTERRATDAGH